MKKENLIFLLPLVLAINLFISSCSDDGNPNIPPQYLPDSGTISGKIIFFGTNRLQTGYYVVVAYTSWPPTPNLIHADTMDIYGDSTYLGFYTIRGLTGGMSYYLVSGWVSQTPISPYFYILGTRGCDTSHSTSCFLYNARKDSIPINHGLSGIDFLSWIDTAKKIAAY
ncbi:MAG TPA: hypothetical protein VGK25_05445 [Ignavibacteria bacterium]